jgi:signal transduction histidine kinase
MSSFLGVPIRIRGVAWGNLYLTEKDSGEFTEADEEVAVMLADWAATAIEIARVYQVSERRREELERAVRGLEATRDIASALGASTDLDRVLELIAKRGRALVEARSLVIMLREGAELVVATVAGHATTTPGLRVEIAASMSGEVFERGRPERIRDLSARLRVTSTALGVPDARTGLLVPMSHRGETVGVLAAFDRGESAEAFTGEDEQLLSTFAATAANAVAMTRSVESDRLRAAIAAADAERGHWARELHDETLQGLASIRLLLSGSLRHADPERYESAMRESIGQLETATDNLRAIIADLRPAALDELGLQPALEALLERRRHGDFEIVSEVVLPAPLDPHVETTVYRLVQEALTNVSRHAQASSVRVAVCATDGELTVEVRDDGVGFPTDAHTTGFGLAGMHERVYLAGGTLTIDSGSNGTTLRAQLTTTHAAQHSTGEQASR